MDLTHIKDLPKGVRWMLVALPLLVVALVALVAAGLVVWARDGPPAWDPLGAYPVQVIDETRGPDGLPVVPPDGLVHVIAEKCADETVTVSGTVSWRSVDPLGTVVHVGDGVGERVAGCERFEFANPIPEGVLPHLERVEVWVIQGTETPIDPAGRVGVPRTWTTEPFRVG